MLNCKQVIDLASNELEVPLPWHKRWQYRLHLMICKNCQRYTHQLRFLHRAGKNLEHHWQTVLLPQEARQRIANKLRN